VHLDLDSLREEVFKYLATEGFAVFRSQAGGLEGLPMIFWDTEAHPEFRDFLAVAKELGARVIIYAHREFQAEEIDEAKEQIEDCDLVLEERRSIERSLSDLRAFGGLTCTLELAFDHQGRLYVFELTTDWFQTFANLSDLLMAASSADTEEDDEDDESGGAFGGYYSKN
jgi:hypothetical protein